RASASRLALDLGPACRRTTPKSLESTPESSTNPARFVVRSGRKPGTEGLRSPRLRRSNGPGWLGVLRSNPDLGGMHGAERGNETPPARRAGFGEPSPGAPAAILPLSGLFFDGLPWYQQVRSRRPPPVALRGLMGRRCLHRSLGNENVTRRILPRAGRRD